MAIITISREMGSGGIPIAHKVAEKLGYRLIDGEAIMAVAKEYGLSPEAVEQADEKPPHFVDTLDSKQFLDLHLIELIILEAALKGNVVIYGRGGQDLLKMSVSALNHYRRSTVGFVWQQSSRNLIPYLNAMENIELPMTLAGHAGRQKRQRAERLLEAIGLADRKDHHLSELSGGEQQRVAIAVALANNPRLLLADEPTGEVDEATALTIYETFHDLNREFGLTTLIVSHDIGLARHVDRVVAIRDGKTAAETVRQSVPNDAQDGSQASENGDQEEVVFEELTVLDSAGRLQVPKDYLDHFSIRGRVRLELTEEGVLIKPAPESDQAHSAEALATELVEAEKAKGWRRFLHRWFPARK